MAAYMLVDNRVTDQEDFNEYIEKIPSGRGGLRRPFSGAWGSNPGR